MAKVRADEIKYALSKRHIEDFFLTEVKTGPSTMTKTLRLDALAIKKSWTQPCFTGYEVKVDRQDFLRDEKYLSYRDYCHRLYLVCPLGLVQPEEVPEDVGLIYYNPEKESLFTKRKALYRDMEIKWEILYYIILSRITTNERHPFFSSDREFIKRYIEDKEDKHFLSDQFKSKLTQQVVDADKRAKVAEGQLQRYEKKAQERDEIVKILIDKELIKSEWNLINNVKEAMDIQYPKELCWALDNIEDAINTAKRIVAPAKEG